jgi:hypothetical protein
VISRAAVGWPRPFAVGVLGVGAEVAGPERSSARLGVALDTYKLGYFLIDTVEIDALGTGCLAVELLVSRTTPDALVVHGSVDSDWVQAVADRHPLQLHFGEEGSGIVWLTRDVLRQGFGGPGARDRGVWG